MKKFINQVELVEDQMIAGMVKAYPQYVRKLDCGNVVVRTEKKEGKVALISGGGSGHEPAHGGYVGTGMLDAFTDSLKGAGRFFKNLLVFLVSALPTLVILAVLFFALRPLFRKLSAKAKARREAKKNIASSKNKAE